jgi:DNA repair photolyase
MDVGVLMMPIIPHLTDDMENLDKIFKTAKGNGATSIFPQLLHLRGNTKQMFFESINKPFPNLSEKIRPLYKGSYIDKNYDKTFGQKLSFLRKKHNFYNKIYSQPIKDIQLELL